MLAAARLDSFGLKQEQIRGVEGSTYVPLYMLHHQAGGVRVRHVRRVAWVEHDVCGEKRKRGSKTRTRQAPAPRLAVRIRHEGVRTNLLGRKLEREDVRAQSLTGDPKRMWPT